MKKSLRILDKKRVDKWVNDTAKRIAIGLKRGAGHYVNNPFKDEHIPRQLAIRACTVAVRYNDGRGTAFVEARVAQAKDNGGLFIHFTESWQVKI